MAQFYTSIDELPEIIPIFPLQAILLLPRGQLPLNIFEPRYLTMVEAAFSMGRVIGMIQPLSANEDDHRLQNVGCLGRITSFSETEEKRMLISLSGITRFHVQEEMDVITPFRQIRADYTAYKEDLIVDVGTLDVNRDGLLHVLRRYLDHNNLSADWDAISQSSNEELVNSLSIISPYGAREKQALLEAESLAERCEVLIALTEMALAQLDSENGSNDNRVQ